MKRMLMVTYCESPDLILDLFEDLESLKRLEVVVGDIDFLTIGEEGHVLPLAFVVPATVLNVLSTDTL
ncbi:hypothetical protein [Halorubrum ezzemoulense]|uniref:hypothetical protein n=1 Tax=Halorubrum ezzemoulense TaxID=337243 RepID=UPI0015C64554|nr:hypothetical protein [Halorubrum ezzemoulense]